MCKNTYNCTLVIPTHNNQQCLQRAITYYKSLDFYVICVDSSQVAYRQEMPSNIKYIHVPGYGFVEKMLYALESIETEYVVCSADDSFIMFETLYKGLSVMDEQEHVLAVLGRCLAFNEHFEGWFYPIYNNKRWKYKKGDIHHNVYDFMNNYNHMILWGAYKKDALLAAYQAVNMAEIKNDNFIGFILGIMLSFQGEIHFLDKIWGVRGFKKENVSGGRHRGIGGISEIQIQRTHGGVEKAITYYTDSECFKIGYTAYMSFCKDNGVSLLRDINKTEIVVRFKHIFLEKKIKERLKSISSILISQ